MTDCWHCAEWAKNEALSREGLCSGCKPYVPEKVYKSLNLLSTHVEIAESDKAALNVQSILPWYFGDGGSEAK